MAPHSSTLAWKIPWTEEPGGLQSMGLLRVGHDFTFTFHFHALEKEMAPHSSVLAWRIQGRESLVGCCLWGRTESDTPEATQQQQQHGSSVFNFWRNSHTFFTSAASHTSHILTQQLHHFTFSSAQSDSLKNFFFAKWHVRTQFSNEGLNTHALQWMCGLNPSYAPEKSHMVLVFNPNCRSGGLPRWCQW